MRFEASENFVIEPTLEDSLEETQFNCIVDSEWRDKFIPFQGQKI